MKSHYQIVNFEAESRLNTMRKIIIATLLSILSISGFAGVIDENSDDVKSVSAAAKKEFQTEFKDAQNVSWVLSNEYQKARFTLNGRKMTAIFDLRGAYIGATEVVALTDLPRKALKAIKKNYGDYSFSEALKVADRPSIKHKKDDVGTYWIDLLKDGSRVYLNYTACGGLVKYRSLESVKTVKN